MRTRKKGYGRWIAGQRERLHESLVDDIFNSPESLGVEGLSGDSIQFRQRGVFTSKNAQAKKRDVMDILFVYEHDGLIELLGVEVKGSMYGRGWQKGILQVEGEQNYLRRNWGYMLNHMQLNLPAGNYRVYAQTLMVSRDLDKVVTYKPTGRRGRQEVGGYISC